MRLEFDAKFALKILGAVFLAVFSVCVLATKVPETPWIQETLDSLETSKNTVMDFTGATMATSLAITALPDDFATPLAEQFADLNKYFILIQIVIFVERLIVVEGNKIAFLFIIPVSCGLYILSQLLRKKHIFEFAVKFAIFGLSLVLVVPCSTRFINVVCADYTSYVEETIQETDAGASKINEAKTNEDEDLTIFEKLSEAFKSSISGINDLMNYFNNEIKKCINSIAILLVIHFVMPLLTLFFFKWLLHELFSVNLPSIIKKASPQNMN